MNFTDFFDTHNEAHREAFEYLCTEGVWPVKFTSTYPEGYMDFSPAWITIIYHRMYQYHILRIAHMEQALKFYADPGNHAATSNGSTYVEMDAGARAINAVWGTK